MYKKTWKKCESVQKKKEDNFHRLQDLWDPILSRIASWDQKWIKLFWPEVNIAAAKYIYPQIVHASKNMSV